MLRISLLCALVACGKSASGPPRAADPAAEPALRADVDMICGAARATRGHVLMSVAPYIAEHMTTDLLASFFANLRTTSTLDDFIGIVRGAMAKTGVDKCDTVDVLVANDPSKKTG